MADPDAIRERSVYYWQLGIGLRVPLGEPSREFVEAANENTKKDYRYLAGLLADWAAEVKRILNYDDNEVRAKHEEVFGSKSD